MKCNYHARRLSYNVETVSEWKGVLQFGVQNMSFIFSSKFNLPSQSVVCKIMDHKGQRNSRNSKVINYNSQNNNYQQKHYTLQRHNFPIICFTYDGVEDT
jgi:hypothetical protein